MHENVRKHLGLSFVSLKIGNAAAARAAHRQLAGHHRQTQQQQKDQIEHQKDAAAVRAAPDREAVNVAQADRAARRNQYEPQSRAEFFSLLHNETPLLHLLSPFTVSRM